MPTLYLLIAAIAGPILVGLGTYGFEELWRTPKAIEKAVQAEAERCDGRIAQIQVSLTNDALSKVDAANSALSTFRPTPAESAALQAVCNAEPACRDRKAK